ncbi:MAG: malto-oligosyltrehalose synthase [Chitinophagaceae bacterium]
MTIPSAAYRIQFNDSFNFSQLSGLMDYLHNLGITAVYASPILQASTGSQHGYDVNDPSRINWQLGTEQELADLTVELRQRGIGWIQDIVPNHMNFDVHNIWLKDVFERGINSSFANYFDIDWEHPFCPGKLMAPVLGEPLKDALHDKEIRLQLEQDGFYLAYYDKLYPVNPDDYNLLLSGTETEGQQHLNASLFSLLSKIHSGPDEWAAAKKDLTDRLLEPALADRIRTRLDLLNDDSTLLSQLVFSQHYLLCDHSISNNQLNYRRFFNVNSMICLRMEDEQVFNDYHQYTYSLYKKGYITGLRIDHVDGLKNPRQYIDRLRKLFGEDCYIIVEKILDIKEDLPDFDIQGTSGYEFLSYVNQVVTDRKGAAQLLDFYKKLVPQFSDYESLVFEKKFSFLTNYLNGEWDNLLRLLLSLGLIQDEEIRTARLKKALGVFMAAFPVYRAYIDRLPLTGHDQDFVTQAFNVALERAPDLHYELDNLQNIFLLHDDPNITANRLAFIQRLMQFTGPLAAKGVEDTSFFLYNPLISHNEVGDQPCVLGIPVKQFHEKMIIRQQKNPLSFNCTSTHDTKRGEDNRMRINMISELADEWMELVKRWQQINAPYRTQLKDVKAPIPNDEYYLYQTLVGGFPDTLELNDDDFIQRTKTFFIKVLRESKLMSDYLAPNEEYEGATLAFIDHLLNPEHEFLASLMPFLKKIIKYANTYVMLQVIIKTTAPGIPEVYRGCELWDLSYVDPDNRRPVDFEKRIRLLDELVRLKKEEGVDVALDYAINHYERGAEKMFVTREILHLRRANTDLFLKGEYIPLYPADGDRVVIAYFRRYGADWILVVLPLAIVESEGTVMHLDLPPDAPKNWTNIFTDEPVSGDSIEVHSLLKRFPVAVLKNI